MASSGARATAWCLVAVLVVAIAGGAAGTESFLWMYTNEPGPQQVHLSVLGGNTVGVTWATLGNDRSGDGIVKYGEAPDRLSYSAKATSVARELKAWKGRFHYAAMRDLRPSTEYYYRVGDAESRSYSEVYSFVSPPEPGTPADFTVAAVGDMGISGEAETTVNRLTESTDSLSLVLHTGGLSYAEGDPTRWDEWATVVEPVAAHVPYMVSVGHDSKSDSAYEDRFMLPTMVSGSPSQYYYSFNYGTVHFVSISTEHPLDSASDQYKWLENDLREATRTRGRNHWVIVYGNKGMYSSNVAHGSDHSVRDGLEELFHMYKVDLCVWGSDNFYERTYPVMHGTAFVSDHPHRYVNPKGIVHLVVGNSGRDLHTEFQQPQPRWSAFREASFGYATIQVMKNDTLYVEYRKNSDNSVGDRVWIAKTSRSAAPWIQHIFASSMLPHASELVRPPPSARGMSPVTVSVIIAVAVVSVFLSAVLTAIALSSLSWHRAREDVEVDRLGAVGDGDEGSGVDVGARLEEGNAAEIGA